MSFCSLLLLTCALTIIPLKATAQGTAPAAITALLKSLFNDRFTSYIAPQLTEKSQIFVSMGNMTLDFDFIERNRLLTIESPLILRWNDPRLVWDPSKYGNVQQLTDVDCWRPLIHYLRSMVDYKLNCDKIKVRHSGDVECLSHLHYEVTCYSLSSSFFTPEKFSCYYGLSWWARINLTCDHAPIDKCLNVSELSTHALYHVEQYRHSLHFVNFQAGGDYYTMWYIINVTRRSSAKVTFLLPILVLGCLVLLQSLLVMNFRERIFLHVLFTEGALVLLYSLEGIPGVRQGEAPLFLRTTGAVLFLNGSLMAVNVALVAATARPGVTSKAVASTLASWVDRLRLSFLWPSSSRVVEAEGEWAKLCVVFDRLLFLLSAVVFAIVVFVP